MVGQTIPNCYLESGQVDYNKLRETPLFKQGISRIRNAWEKQLRVALMCSELKPDEVPSWQTYRQYPR